MSESSDGIDTQQFKSAYDHHNDSKDLQFKSVNENSSSSPFKSLHDQHNDSKEF